MRRNIAIALTALVVVAFFLPWVSVESGGMVGKVSKLLQQGEKSIELYSVSGFKVPILANSDESKMMIMIIELFQPKVTNADKKSYLIWLIPLMAIAIFFAGDIFKNNKLVFLCIGIIGVMVFLGATFKIMTTELDKAVIKASIGYGLWLTLVGYLGLGVLAITKFLEMNKKVGA